MGGVLILAALSISTLLWADLDQPLHLDCSFLSLWVLVA